MGFTDRKVVIQVNDDMIVTVSHISLPHCPFRLRGNVSLLGHPRFPPHVPVLGLYHQLLPYNQASLALIVARSVLLTSIQQSKDVSTFFIAYGQLMHDFEMEGFSTYIK